MIRKLLAVLLLCAPVSAVEVPESPVNRDTLVHLKPAPGERVFVLPQWFGPQGPKIEVVTTSDGDRVFTGPPGIYAILGFTETSESQQWIEIVDTAPVPPPIPTPPTPAPDPPTPIPVPTPVPFPAVGLTVMTVYEAQEMSKLPASQVAIFSSSKVQKYLNEKCLRIGNDPAWRYWDDDLTTEQLAFAPAQLTAAYKATVQQSATRLPWICISDGAKGFSGPLPTTVDGMLQLLQKFGG